MSDDPEPEPGDEDYCMPLLEQHQQGVCAYDCEYCAEEAEEEEREAHEAGNCAPDCEHCPQAVECRVCSGDTNCGDCHGFGVPDGSDEDCLTCDGSGDCQECSGKGKVKVDW